MKNDSAYVAIFIFVLGLIFGAPAGGYFMKKQIDHRAEKEAEQMEIYSTGGFRLTFSVNEDAVDLEGKEALIDLMEQFSMDLAETTAAYRSDGNVEHIKLFKARIKGDRQTEALLRMWLKDRVSAKPSKGD